MPARDHARAPVPYRLRFFRGHQPPCGRISRDAELSVRVHHFTTPDVLVVDDLGLRGLAQDEPADLYEIVRRRYEHGSTIITSNRAIEEWPPMFGNRCSPAPRWTASSTTRTSS